MEYTKVIKQDNYTTNIIDENYPIYKKNTVYEKGALVIFEDVIFQSRKYIGLIATFVYTDTTTKRASDSLVIDSAKVSIKTDDYVYVSSSKKMYKYIGTEKILNFKTQTFTSDFTDLGEQLNGYEINERKPTIDDESLFWKKISAVNSKRAFDNYNFTPTIAPLKAIPGTPSEIEYKFTTKLVNKIALFNLDASEVEIKVKLSEGAEHEDNAITKTYDLTTYSGDQTNAGYLFTKVERKEKLIVDVPLFGYMEITIKIRKESDYAKVGDITLGKSNTMGCVLDGIPMVTKDYSSYDTSKDGIDTFVPGGYKKEISFSVLIDTIKKNIVSKELDALRGDVLVFDLSPKTNDEIFQYKGFLKKSQPNITTNWDKSAIDITIVSRLEK